MKIIALIADDNKPDGRAENHFPPKYDFTHAEAQDRMERMVRRYNEMLRPGELPRRLLSVQLVECTEKEAYALGWQAMEAEDGIEDNFFPAAHPLHLEWRSGYKDAEEAWVEAEGDEGEEW